MYSGLIITKDAHILAECSEITASITNLTSKVFRSFDDLEAKINISNHLFVIVSELDSEVFKYISKYNGGITGPVVLFYNHSINYDELPEVNSGSKVKMIIGDNRKTNLKNQIIQLQAKFWRRIPYSKLGINIKQLSSRMKQVMQYIETEPIRDCNINSIATYLNISPGYFSQEFKRETKISFRNFMQVVISHYENIIFSQVNLPTKNISKILGYSELSSFSRSFKNRNGMSPTKYKKILS